MDVLRMVDRAPSWVRSAATRVMQGGGILGGLVDRIAHPYRDEDAPPLPADPELEGRPTATVRLLIGPANEVEQGYHWARSAERLPGVSAVSMMGFDPGGYGVQADLRVPEGVYLRSRVWHRTLDAYLRGRTHVIWESGLPLLGRASGSDAFAEAERLRAAGVSVAMIFHGSDIRPPQRHAAQNPWSPFRDRQVPSRLFADRAERNLRRSTELSIPVFVSTPDLLQWVPDATWCPVVVDSARWRVAAAATRVASERPVVVHAPSNPLMKGTHRIEPTLRRLDAEGLIEYRQIVGVPHADMPAAYAKADIVLDQFAIGSYGVASCEALAAGKVVLGHIDSSTREVVRRETGVEVPILEVTSDSLETELRQIVAAPERFEHLRTQGPEFVEKVHDGRRSAEALAAFLGAADGRLLSG